MGDRTTSMDVAVAVPEGFVALPLRDVDGPVNEAGRLFAELGTNGIGAAAPAVLQALRFFLGRLGALGVVYCGLGKHCAADGSEVTSTLVVTADRYGEPQNPRLTIADYLVARTGDYRNSEVVRFGGKYVLLSDRVMLLPAPEWDPTVAVDDAEVYQLEAVVPSADGSAIVVVELSTPFVDKGEEFLSAMVAISASIEMWDTSASMSPSSLNM